MGGSTLLPEPLANPALRGLDGARLTSPDLYFDEAGLAVMIHSRAYHDGGDQWENTVEGDSDLVERAVLVLGVTPRHLAREPAAILRQIERAFARAKEQGHRAHVIVHPRETVDPGRRRA